MPVPPQRDIKWDKKTVEDFQKRFIATMTYGEQSGVPMPVMEGLMRDWLAQLEAIRAARQLAAQWQAMGFSAFTPPH